MLGRIRLFLHCIDYSISMLIIVCCLAFGSWWFSAENYSYEESLYPREEYYQDVCKIYSDLAVLSQQRKDWKAAIDAYQAALDSIVKNDADLQKLKGERELLRLLLPIYDRLTFCYEQLGDAHNVSKIREQVHVLNTTNLG